MKEIYITSQNIKTFTDHILSALKPFGRTYDHSLQKENAALLIIDMQEFFLHPDAHGFIPSAGAILPNIKRLQQYFLDKEMPVVLTQHVNTDDDAGMMKIRWQEMISIGHPHVAIIDELKKPGCQIIQKPQFDAFYKSNLEDLLRTMGVTQLVITGVMTNLCCETTLRSAFVRGFEPYMPVDATAAYNYWFHLGTFRNLSYGFTQAMSTDQIIETLSK